MKVELKGIDIVMGDKSVKLSIADAQELRKQLNKLFGEKIQYVSTQPIVVDSGVWPWWKQYPDYRYPQWTYTTQPTSPTCEIHSNPNNGIAVYCCTEGAK